MTQDTEATGVGAARVSLNSETIERDIAKLVFALMETLRELMERQALRRMEAGTLTEAEQERVGTTLMQAREQILKMARQFGLQDDDLSIDLGPLGRLR